MALTSTDETDLILPLFTGMRENPRFATFLERLRRRTDANHIGLIHRTHDWAGKREATYFAGEDLRRRAVETGSPDPFETDHALFEQLRPNRVYSLSELVEHDPVARAARARRMANLGLADERIVRITDGETFTAWLMLARSKPCSAADSALLSNLAPYVAIALGNLVAAERDRLLARINSLSLTRAGRGWMTFDREQRLTAIDPETASYWERHCGGEPRIGERLRALDKGAERELAMAITDLSDNPQHPAHPVLLRRGPRMEALLMAMDGGSEQPGDILALVPLPHDSPTQGATRLSQVHDLPPREAELAMALAGGHSIAESAERMGLTLETARNYSKRLYAKLGVRGQAELVRLVYESTAVLA
ncbi:helix-turn-helix transcriptional regulator [Novosphingobium sp. KN65.2]|uniref:helix-turn-helix transcriptional regulator n=1 Tax=Novosphingobium sp. KN65.2 TaxID=1478134 RepID=UPI0005E26590|nr:helix-turn-helix transcriptional regulator [Novosphingobium sp. KN65.2]CDO37677.1 putative Regulatory protein, LuxR [Novosphingobium sp. KN65.2]